MKLRILLPFLTAGLMVGGATLSSASATPATLAAPKKKEAEAKDKAEPGKLNARLKLRPKGLRWGLSLKQLSKLYAKVFEKEFVPLYKRVQPGPRMKALDDELEKKQQLIRQHHIKFGKVPTGIDSTALKGEYTYRNGESMTHVRLRSGVKRHFFFFNDSLWKVYDERKLRKGGPLGETFEEAQKILTKKLKVAPVVHEPAPKKGQYFQTAEWTDGSTILRLVNREHEKVIAVVWISEDVHGRLDALRKDKGDGNKVDKDVEMVTRKSKKGPKDPNKNAADAYGK